jgi:pimeloyl-ACP methyl ester carboxylesterase
MSSSGHADEASREYDPQQIRLADGRALAYCLYGPESGTPVLFQYGMPGTMFLAPERLSPLDDLGIRLVVPDRPGYGQSTRLPGRSVAAVANDVSFLVDHLGWDRFAIWGASGGGPHALACAALIGDRITRCASAVSPAPFDADGLDWLGRHVRADLPRRGGRTGWLRRRPANRARRRHLRKHDQQHRLLRRERGHLAERGAAGGHHHAAGFHGLG